MSYTASIEFHALINFDTAFAHVNKTLSSYFSAEYVNVLNLMSTAQFMYTYLCVDCLQTCP